MTIERRTRGLIDTSVVIDLPSIDLAALPEQSAISAITVAELTAGPHATDDPNERARRQERLQWAETHFDPLPFDDRCARAFGRAYAATRAHGRDTRRRLADLLIAATGAAHDLPMFTRKPDDFAGLADVVDIIDV